MRKSIISIGSFLLVLLGSSAGFWFWQMVSGAEDHQKCLATNNAAWISVDWTSERVDERKVAALAQNVIERDIRYLYPFTTYVRENDFSPSYTYAEEFVTTFKNHNDRTLLLAWVGVPLKRTGEVGIDGWTELQNEDERKRIVGFVTKLVTGAGFDGVHLNVETVWSGDEHYLLLLDEMKQALGEGYIISISGHSWRGTETVDENDYRWDSKYYRAVGERTDQVVAMTYDSMATDVSEYENWLQEQMMGIAESVSQTDTELLYGLSISREQTLTHDPKIENMENSLKGICSGERNVEGIAVYAAWEAEAEDWAVWEAYFGKE